MLTPDGQAVLLELLHTYAEAAVLRVWENDDVTADASMDDGFPTIEEGEVVFQATFGGDAANFNWQRHAVVVGDRIIDSTDEDLGTKVPGSEWTLRSRVSFAALAPTEE